MARPSLSARAAIALPTVALGIGLLTLGQSSAVLADIPESPASTPSIQQAIQIPAESITLNADSLYLMAGTSETLMATVNPPDTTDAIVWQSSDLDVAEVAPNGKLHANAAGTATITATAGATQAGCDITVWQPVTSISLNRKTFAMEGGDVRQLVAECMPEDATNKTVTWESSNPNVASVNPQTGLVSAIAAGKTAITAIAADGAGAKQTCEVIVTSTAYTASKTSQLQSPHPYANNCTDSWTYTIPGAYQLSVTFDKRTNMENTFDYIEVFDGSGSMLQAYTGTALSGATITVSGDTVHIKLTTDDQTTEWGFAVTSIERLYPPEKEEKPSKPAAPDTLVTPDNPDKPTTPPADWNLVMAPDGTVASDYVAFQLPEAWVGLVNATVANDASSAVSQLNIFLAGHPDCVLASFALADTGSAPAAQSVYDVPIATWDNGNGKTIELWITNWPALAYEPSESMPDTEILAQLVNLSTGGSMTLEEAQKATEEPPSPTYGADELVSSAQVPLYVDGKAVGYAVPAAIAVPAEPAPETPAADSPSVPMDEPADNNQDTDGNRAPDSAQPDTESMAAA